MLERVAPGASEAASRQRKPLDADALFFDSRRHFEALFLNVQRHLEDGRPDLAFPHADRRCRLPSAGARDFLLRAEISRRAGFLDERARDLDRAFELDPTDRLVLQAALMRGEPAQKSLAARLVLSDAAAADALVVLAVDWLMDEGETTLLALGPRDRALVGWAAWTGAEEFRLRLAGDSERLVALKPEPDHWLARETGSPRQSGWTPARMLATATLLRNGAAAAARSLAAGPRAFADAAPEPARCRSSSRSTRISRRPAPASRRFSPQGAPFVMRDP